MIFTWTSLRHSRSPYLLVLEFGGSASNPDRTHDYKQLSNSYSNEIMPSAVSRLLTA
jgi:hypothetical protein